MGILLASGETAPAFDTIASARVVSTPPMPEPGYLRPARDLAFGTFLMRVTNPGRELVPGGACRTDYCRHRYSSAQAWNADQSLLLIEKGCTGLCFLDGRTYRPLFGRRPPGECEWHPTNAALMICIGFNEISTWAVRTNVKTRIWSSTAYRNLHFGPSKSNPSADGNRLVVRGTDSTGALVAFAFDIPTARKFPDIKLARLAGSNSFCTIAASGRFILCVQNMGGGTHTAYVFTVDGRQRQHWTENQRPGHGDLTVDRDGKDVYVGISKDDPDKYNVIKRRLEDGVVTVLAPIGYAQHASIRSTRRTDWVFVTFAGTYAEAASRPKWTPFYQEVVAVRLDGSREIRRIVQTRSMKHDYESEAHASPSPDGSQVIWASNWGRAGGPVAAYVARLAWPTNAQVATLPPP
jgi:hypothetical protein